MVKDPERQTALGDVAARQLANATKTVPQLSRITPRWLTHLLQWVPVEAGIYRLNRVKDEAKVEVDCSDRDERVLPQTFVDYEEHPREYMLSAVNTVVDVHTRVSDLYSVPYNQTSEQLRLTIEIVKERQESELVNNREYGLLHNVAEKQADQDSRKGSPTPDDLDDELLTQGFGRSLGFFLGSSECHRGVRTGVHTAWRSAAHGVFIRVPISDLARRASGPLRQGGCGRRQDQYPADPHRRAPSGRGGSVSTKSPRPAEHRALGSLHGHQPQSDIFLPGVFVLLPGGLDRRRAWSAGRRGDWKLS